MKLKASSTIEIIVSMIILVTVVSLSAGIYTNVLASSKLHQIVAASYKGEQTLESFKRHEMSSGYTDNWNGLSIVVKVSSTDFPLLNLVSVDIYNEDGKILWEAKKLVKE